MIPRIWPGFLAIWAAIILHFTWVVLLLWPGTHAGNSTPVHSVVGLAGGPRMAAMFLFVVATIATVGTARRVSAAQKMLYVLPQQLILGVSAAGAILAMFDSHYADGVTRPGTFIVADQLAIVLTWAFHTAAIVFLFLIHKRRVSFGGRSLPPNE